MTTYFEGVVVVPAGVKHGRNTYQKWKCRCDICRAANTKHCNKTAKARRAKRAVYLLHCDDCPFTTTTDRAAGMHEHTLRHHARYITNHERTPRP